MLLLRLLFFASRNGRRSLAFATSADRLDNVLSYGMASTAASWRQSSRIHIGLGVGRGSEKGLFSNGPKVFICLFRGGDRTERRRPGYFRRDGSCGGGCRSASLAADDGRKLGLARFLYTNQSV